MPGELAGVTRRAVGAQVGRSGAHEPLARAEPARHERAVLEAGPDAHRDVDAFLDEVDAAVVEQHVELHLGEAALEVGQQRREPDEPERHRCADAEPAPRRLLQATHRVLRLLKVAEQPYAALEVQVPGIGQREPSRGSHQQLRAEVLLELRHELARPRRGDGERARRRGEAARVDHRTKRAHAG
jgi:hypothetical protein